MLVSFTTKSKELLQTLTKMNNGVGLKNILTTNPICEITITDNKVTLNIPGAEFYIGAVTQGTAKVTLPFLYLLDVVKCESKIDSTFIIEDGRIILNELIFNANTNFFNDDKILRSINLPINYTNIDLLRLRNGRYTEEEINFNKLYYKIKDAEKELKKNIRAAFKALKGYGITKIELEKLVSMRLQNNETR